MLINMADTTGIWILPTRDYVKIETTVLNAQSAAADAFQQYIGGTPRVREGYWYDLQLAGATAYSGSNELTFASSSNKYGFPDAITLPITVPQAKVFAFFGISDYSANPSLQAFQISQNDVAYPIVYLSPHIYTAEDHTVYLNGNFPAIQQNQSMTITLFGTAATTEPIDIKFKVAEQAAKTS